MPLQSKRPVFCFLDESGTIGGGSRYFAIGAIVHPMPDELNEKLHAVFEGYVAARKRDRTSQEFHFKELTEGTRSHYVRALQCLKADPDWRFFSVVLDLSDPLFHMPKTALESWACYLRWIKLLLLRNLKANEKATLLADFLRRPTGASHRLDTLPAVVPQLWDVLQVESQGILLVQMADCVVGSFAL